MEITITHNINLNAPALLDFVKTLSEADLARRGAIPAKTPSPALEKEIAAQNAAAPSADPTEAPRRGGRAKKDAAAPAPASPASPAAVKEGDDFANPASWTKEEKEKNLAIVRGRLSDYSADKRYGMDGVFAILKKYGVERITALPAERYAEFKKELDEALTKPAADPLA